MASEYHTVRSRILARGHSQRRTALLTVEPLTPIHPPSSLGQSIMFSPSAPSDIPSAVKDAVREPSLDSPSTNFLSQLAEHVKNISETRIAGGFIHLTPSLIHSNAFLIDPVHYYQRLTDLFRRIDINMFNMPIFKLEDWISNNLTRLVYSSNYLSHEGTDFSTTKRISRSIFTGSGITELNLPNTPAYRSELATLEEQGRAAGFATVLKGREQTVRFSKALVYFLEQFIIEKKDITEELIKETHKIIVKDHESVDNKPWEDFAGWYRDYQVLDSNDSEIKVLTGTTRKGVPIENPSKEEEMEKSSVVKEDPSEKAPSDFKAQGDKQKVPIDPKAVSVQMSKLVNMYHSKSAKDIESEGSFNDPFALAAWLYTEFLHVHPFIVLNGAIAKIMVTGLLLKELGIVAVLGEGKDARNQYISVLGRWKDKYRKENEGTEEKFDECYAEFAALMVKKGASCIEDLAALVGTS